MCGRYGLREIAAAEKYFGVHGTPWKVSYNIAPTQLVPIVRIREGERVGQVLRWGLIPFFARGVPPKASTINARIETVETAPSYKGAWARGARRSERALLSPRGRRRPREELRGSQARHASRCAARRRSSPRCCLRWGVLAPRSATLRSRAFCRPMSTPRSRSFSP